ncbi:dnaJ homolog subfamily B member 6 isoform X1 [Rosa chinensis]|uniref:dnaJ homolog subfamily B member 6 isoform X1 n=1 Tax=Rosa chinensis TaxID=74649 RepID=UPI000D089A6D|nr:dnaJ homolog subfamily B member 6 isoform X1 [Rosa chinensis]
MANREEKGNDFYAVLGLKKECSDSELRNAYKKLALRWHPDRCSATGNSKFVEEAKKKFQDIQQAYSVLSDANKRFMYDVGAYEGDDDENGMGDFLNEMAVMMSQTKPNENGGESFEQLQELFEEMFQGDIESFSSCSQPPASCSTSSSSYVSYCESSTPNNKRNSSEMNYGNATLDSSGFDTHFHSFCVGAESQQGIGKGMSGREGIPGGVTSRRREGRKQKVTSGHDVSSNDHSGISAR